MSREVEPVEDFIGTFSRAMQSQNIDFLLERLHPAVTDLYGAEACQRYLPQVIDHTFNIQIRNVGAQEPWMWEIDDRSTPIDEAYSVDAIVLSRGQTITTEMHLTPVDGLQRWFTDCGEPLQ